MDRCNLHVLYSVKESVGIHHNIITYIIMYIHVPHVSNLPHFGAQCLVCHPMVDLGSCQENQIVLRLTIS